MSINSNIVGNELLDVFTDRLHQELPLIQTLIASLQTDKTDATAKLFRIFHNYKASASYLGLKEFHTLSSAGENILNALRWNDTDVTEYDIQWFDACTFELQNWCEQLMENKPLSPLNKALFPTISILDNSEKTADVMQGLNVLYSDFNLARSNAIKAPLGHVFKSVSTTDSVNDLKTALLNNSIDIFILNLQEQSVEAALELLEIKSDIALIVAIPDLRTYQKSRLLLKGLTHPIASPIKSSDLKRQLHNIVTSHFSKVHTVISHQTIYNFIQALDPLSSSVKKIIQLCDDPESSIKELINVIESDAITTANILHAASSPIYGIERTSSIEKAVASFGKRMIKALTLSELACTLGSLDLKAYGINELQFKQASSLRLALMNRWYARVNNQDLAILGASAILGNLGNILINQELINAGLLTDFQNYDKKNLAVAEVTLLKTSTAFVTADILEFWSLDSELIDAIRYSDSPFNTGTARLQSLACANAVVYQMVTPYGELLQSIPKSVEVLLQKSGLEKGLLEEAVKRLEEERNKEAE